MNDLKLELIFKKETEHKSLENLQTDHVVERKIPFSVEEFKLATEICMMLITKTMGENTSKAFQRPLQQSLPSQAWRPKREKWFHGSSSGSHFSVQHPNMVPCIVATPTSAMAKRVPDMSQGTVPGGANCKFW